MYVNQMVISLYRTDSVHTIGKIGSMLELPSEAILSLLIKALVFKVLY